MKKAEELVAKLYIFFLPIRMITPLVFLQNYVGGCALNLDFIFHMLGLFLFWVNSGNLKLEKQTKKIWCLFIILVFVFTILNLINALYYHEMLGVAFGEDSIHATRGSTLYWLHYALIITYNIRVFYLLGKDKIWKIIKWLSYFLLFIGYIQILVIFLRSNFICNFYDALARETLFLPSSYLLTENRITLTTTEPAHAAYIIIRLVLPLLLSELVAEGFTGRNIGKILIWLPVIYFLKSSNGYILAGVEFTIFAVLMLRKILRQHKICLNFFSGSILITSCGILLLLPFILEKINISDFVYTLFLKLTDQNNMSTAWRVAPLYINWEIFKRFPIIGIGNGNQGFFYWEFFPQWAYDLLAGTKMMEWNSQSLPNGLLFIPSILSGYGIIGTLLFTIFILFEVKYMWEKRNCVPKEFAFFMIALGGIIINGFSADFPGSYDIWFILSIPFLDCNARQSYKRIKETNKYEYKKIMHSSDKQL